MIQKGRDLLLKVADGAGGFTTVAGLRQRAIAFNAEMVDVSHAESAGQWRELLAGAGLKRASLSGTGIFRDAASDAMIRADFFDGVIRDWRAVIPDFGVVEGRFQVTALEFAGTHNGEMTFDLTLESAGALSFAAA